MRCSFASVVFAAGTLAVSTGAFAGDTGFAYSHDLRKEGYLDAVRGRSGGVRLAKPAEEIIVGAIVRHTEGGFDLVDCKSCVIARACSLTGALHQALAAFMAVLDNYTLADLVRERHDGLRQLLAEINATDEAEAA